MLYDSSKGFLTEMKEGIQKLASGDVTKRMPGRELTRICQDRGHMSVHGFKADLAAGGICPKSLLDSLAVGEKRDADALEKTGRMKQYCIGRVLAKRAVVDVCTDIGVRVKPEMVSVVDDERGAPQCKIESPHELPTISVSLTHKRNIQMAVASASERVGIDLEDLSETSLGAARWTTVDPEGQLKNAVRSTVQRLSGYTDAGKIATVMWCAKEAAYKALSRGRQLSPLQIELEPGDDHLVARAGQAASLQVRVMIASAGLNVCALAI